MTAYTKAEYDSTIRLYQNHGNSIGYWEGWVSLDGTVFITYAKTLDGKPVTKQYQAQPKNVGKSNETTAFEQGVLELQSKARLKLDKGYVRTLEEAQAPSTNTLGLLKPMLATPIEKVKPEKITWENAYVQPKLDGHRGLHDEILYSRQGKELILPHIVEAIHAAGLQDLHLDGELYLHGYTLQELSKLIKKHRPETLDLQYHIYDVVDAAPFHQRIQKLQERIQSTPGSILQLVPTYPVAQMETALTHHNSFRAQGYEGTMLRFGDDHYQDGKRSRSLLKLKEFHDDEFEIIGVEDGKPYVTDHGIYRVPVYECDAGNGKTFTVTAPGNMQEKNEQWEMGKAQIGEMLTVKYHYLSAEGIPQLPVALRFRDDV